ncbi:RSP4 [Scenedesmus sp. PABB004]|nr:RSP4 [Scenedesmus sp. PABB004]
MASAEVQEAVALLQKTGSSDGGSLYEQLTHLIAKARRGAAPARPSRAAELARAVLEEKPSNPVDLRETALLNTKAAGAPGAAAAAPPSIADAARAVAAAKLYGAGDVPIDSETGEPVEVEPPNEARRGAAVPANQPAGRAAARRRPPEQQPPPRRRAAAQYECEDIQGDAALFSALGVGLGRAEMTDVALAVKRLGEDPRKGVATVRFFGKFFGTHADYYVFETTLRSPPEEPERGEGEAAGEAPLEWGSGANAYVYFVGNALGGPLTQLPHVTPAQARAARRAPAPPPRAGGAGRRARARRAQVKAARQLKRLLTGRLDARVSSYPVFPGREANFLRAQIARISCTTVVCPAGLFVVNEDGGLEAAEEPPQLPVREMGAPANWVHRYPHLKRQGRCAVHKREAPEGEEDSFEYTEEELEEGPEQLAALEGDDEVGGGPAWSPLFSSSDAHVKNQARTRAAPGARAAVAGLRSNLWPGAACACLGPRFTNVYVGWGAKAGPYLPPPPPPVAAEYDAALVESAELPPRAAPGGDGALLLLLAALRCEGLPREHAAAAARRALAMSPPEPPTECADGSPFVECLVDPCASRTCRTGRVCASGYCEKCSAQCVTAAPCANGAVRLNCLNTASACIFVKMGFGKSCVPDACNGCSAVGVGPCKPGRYVDADALACVRCRRGFACAGGNSTTATADPQPCNGGFYSPNPGAAVCTRCPPGHMTPSVPPGKGYTECKPLEGG